MLTRVTDEAEKVPRLAPTCLIGCAGYAAGKTLPIHGHKFTWSGVNTSAECLAPPAFVLVIRVALSIIRS